MLDDVTGKYPLLDPVVQAITVENIDISMFS